MRMSIDTHQLSGMEEEVKKNLTTLADEFLSGHHESDINQASKAISKRESLRPDFSLLEKMLQSDHHSSVEAALYILYNKGELFPPSILRITENLMSHPNAEIRMWAQSCLT